MILEETEWCSRGRARGIGMVWVPQARIVHKEGRSTGAGGGFRRLSDLSFHYIVRNSMLFTEARHPFWLSTVLLFNVFEALLRCGRGDFRKPKVLVRGLRDYWNCRSKWQRELPVSGD
jgi:GT2 family glycosyltransferase